MRRSILCLTCIVTFCLSALSGERDIYTTSMYAARTTDVITIDGDLSESVWQRAGFTTFLQKEPEEGKPATERTEL